MQKFVSLAVFVFCLVFFRMLNYWINKVNTKNFSLKDRCPIENSPLHLDLLSVLQYETFSDFSLISGNGYIPVHRVVLCARSPVFRAMLTKDPGKQSEDASDFNIKTLEDLAVFLYTDSVPDLDLERALKLYSAAHNYEVFALRDRCSEMLVSNLSVQNVLSVVPISHKHGDDYLKKNTVDYFMSHEQEVFDSQQWLEFMKQEPALALELAYSRLSALKQNKG